MNNWVIYRAGQINVDELINHAWLVGIRGEFKSRIRTIDDVALREIIVLKLGLHGVRNETD